MNEEQLAAAIYDHAKSTSLSILDSGEEVAPVVLVIRRDGEMGACLSPMGMGDRFGGRNGARAAARAFYAMLNRTAAAFCVVTECWQVKAKPGQQDLGGVAPSDHPDRTEALMVTLYQGGREMATAMMSFTRVGGIVTHGAWMETGAKFEFKAPEGSIFPSDE